MKLRQNRDNKTLGMPQLHFLFIRKQVRKHLSKTESEPEDKIIITAG